MKIYKYCLHCRAFSIKTHEHPSVRKQPVNFILTGSASIIVSTDQQNTKANPEARYGNAR